ncbi:hypothetical protein L873DRAFT_874483 [Choiromyces venosus 120613-1]|uniref:Uncharacterized protein n=1 Tax=Choiromyces venosus 120613-1 TaxID=1336337 RepID=A0A3N4JR24_9PEZI|nr:hypothetical protein L873DRAFT_874483 [Choiromyces venosus 120613-1]
MTSSGERLLPSPNPYSISPITFESLTNLRYLYSRKEIMGRTYGASEISLEICCTILTIYLFTQKTWNEISSCLHVHPHSAQQICLKAKDCASNPEDFQDLYAVLKSLDHPGCPEVIPEGSKNSLTLMRASQSGPDGYTKTFP